MNPTPNEVPTDADRIDELEKILKLTGSPIIAFNDDPDIDCEDSPNGLMPVGFRIVFDGCQGVSMFVGDTLRSAIDATRAPLPASVPSGGAAEQDAFKQWNDAKFRTLLAADADTWYYSDAHKRMAWDAGVEYGRRNTHAPAPMGETPETDAAEWTGHAGDGDWAKVVFSDFARKLESERDKALADLSALREKADAMAAAMKLAKPYLEKIILELGLSGERMHGTKIQTTFNAINEALTAYTGKEAK